MSKPIGGRLLRKCRLRKKKMDIITRTVMELIEHVDIGIRDQIRLIKSIAPMSPNWKCYHRNDKKRQDNNQ